MRLGRMYGRDLQLRAITRALQAPGAVVTVTGLPGSGRTSVALAATQEVAGPDGPHPVEGRRVARPGALDAAIELRAGPDPVLVDDVDLVPDAHDVVSRLRLAQPDRRVLLVSRTPLGLADEFVVRLPPLPPPDPTEDPDVLRDHPAVQLFLDVAVRTGTAADMQDLAIGDVARICRELGGLPLAISLVAARTATYSPATLVGLLGNEPTSLLRPRSGARADEVHDLFAAVALSISLLGPGEQALLQDLTVFHGPVGLDAVAEVSRRPDVVDELSALVDVHLVEPRHDARGSRFCLPPLVRGYLTGTAASGPSPELRQRHLRWARRVAADAVALERSGRLTEVREVLTPLEGDLMAALEEAVGAGRAGDAGVLLLALLPVWHNLGVPHDVTRTISTVLDLSPPEAAGRASGPPPDVRPAARPAANPAAPDARPAPRDDDGAEDRPARADVLALAAWRELLLAESARNADEVVAACSSLAEVREEAQQVGDACLLEVTCLAVQAARQLVDRKIPERWAHEGRELAERLGDPVSLSRLETWCGMFAHQRGDFQEAARWARRAVARSRALEEPSLVLRPAGLLWGLPPDHGRSEDLLGLDHLVDLARDCGDLSVLDWLEPTAAFTALNAGDLAGAARHSAATLRRVRGTGVERRGVPAVLCLFFLAVRTQDLRWAGRLQGTLTHHDEVLKPSLPPHARAVYDHTVRSLEAAINSRPETATEVAWGSRLSPEDALDMALTYAAEVRKTHVDGPPWRAPRREAPEAADAEHPEPGAELTDRELDVLARLVSGGTNRDISNDLGISAKTVMHHTSAIYRKLGVRGRAEAVAWFLRHPAFGAGADGAAARADLRLVRGEAEG